MIPNRCRRIHRNGLKVGGFRTSMDAQFSNRRVGRREAWNSLAMQRPTTPYPLPRSALSSRIRLRKRRPSFGTRHIPMANGAHRQPIEPINKPKHIGHHDVRDGEGPRKPFLRCKRHGILENLVCVQLKLHDPSSSEAALLREERLKSAKRAT